MVRDSFDVSHGCFMHGRNRLDMGNIRICGVYRIGRLVTYQMAGDETMMIFLDKPEEIEAYLASRAAVKNDQYFKENGWEPFAGKRPEQSPNGMLTNWPSHHKEEIMSMVVAGKYPREIARALGLNERSVKHLVYSEKKKARQEPVDKTSGNDATIPARPEESPIIEPTTRQERIDAIMLIMSGRGESHVTIAAEVNNRMGGSLMPDDVAKRLVELRSGL